MINLLPPELKRELRYAKLNARLVHYLWLCGGMIIILALMFTGAIVYLNVVSRATEQDLTNTKASIASYADFSAKAKSVSQRLAAIKLIDQQQTHFSLLLGDIAKVLPQGTALSGIVLTGDDSKPVQLSVTAPSYNQALAVRDAVATSPRIAAADLVSISGTNGVYTAGIVIAFKPGEAK